MEYFILLEGDPKSNCQYDCNKLGETNHFGQFWTFDGFKVFNNLVNNYPEKLETITLLDGKGKEITITEFLTILKQYKLVI